MEYRQEFLAQVKQDIQNLLIMHYDEIALDKDAIKLNPDWEAYQKAEDEGLLKGFTARQDGELVGYFVVIASRHIHYKDHIFAANDVIFIHPEHRKGFAAMRLIKFAEKCLKEDGVSILTINTKCHKPFDVLLDRMMYKHIENVYRKRLN